MRFRLFVLAVLCGLLTPLYGSSQTPVKLKARELFVNKQADGIEVTVKWLDKNGQFVVVDPSRNFKKGDELRVEFQSNFNGLAYFLNVTPTGVTRIIHKGAVRADVRNDLPAGPNTIQFDNESGAETLKILIARQPIEEFEAALNKSGGVLGATAAGVADELSRNNKQTTKPNQPSSDQMAKAGRQNPKPAPVSEEVGFVTPKPGQECGGLELAYGGQKIKCRGMLVAKGNEKRGEGAVFVAASNSAQSGALQTGDVAVIELRFKHVKVPE
jgi:hypothetical protein